MDKDWVDRTLTIDRIFDAPRSLLWEVWTHQDHIAKWWGPPGMRTKVNQLDFRPGGRWKYTMTAKDGKVFPAEGVYQEIIEPEKIVKTANFAQITVGVVLTITFEALENKTRLTLSVTHPTKLYRDKQERMGVMNGWGAALSKLESYLFTRLVP